MIEKWKVSRVDIGAVVKEDAEHKIVAVCGKYEDTCLIAAAPELLEALKRISDPLLLPSDGIGMAKALSIIEAMRREALAAIAKAERPGMPVRIEEIERRATLYRVGRSGYRQGLWYDGAGNETHRINMLTEGKAAALPMGPHWVFRDGGKKWISVTDSLPALANWFSPRDMGELAADGYVVEAIEVGRYRRLHFPTYSHEVYSEDAVISFQTVPHSAPYEGASL